MNECPECGSDRIVKNAVMHDRGDYNAEGVLQVAVDQNPGAWVFKERVRSNLKAEVCGDCGFLQPYATDPQELWDAYQKVRSDIE
jgi:predicted RNA-binding Zn-ribbon protein involved in translation (DUF1610 family)